MSLIHKIRELIDWEYEDKFYTYARKIEDEVARLEEYGTEEEIVEYLEACAEMREYFLDPDNLSEIEEYYTRKINESTFERYGVPDPIFDKAFG